MKSVMSAAAARRIALSCTAVGFRSNFTVAAASAAAGPATDSMQSSTAADVEAVWRLFMAWSSHGNDHQAQLLTRSDERRLGKEGVRRCRTRGSPDNEKKQ